MSTSANQRAYAGFWIRAVAGCIDNIIISIIYLPALLVPHLILHNVFLILSTVIPVIIIAGLYVSPWQATPGKRLMNIYIIDAKTGNRVTFFQGILRVLTLFTICIPIYINQFFNVPPATISDTSSAAPLSKADIVYIFYTLISFAGFIVLALIFAAVMAFTRQKTGPHDLIARTRVIKGRPDPSNTDILRNR